MKRRLLPLVLLALGVVGYAWAAPKIPHDQSVEIALGDRAKDVTDMTIRYAHAGEIEREVSLHFANGAPALVKHAARLPDGDYEIDVETAGARGALGVTRKATLKDGTITTLHAERP